VRKEVNCKAVHSSMLSNGCLAFHLNLSLLSTQTSKTMLLHNEKHKEITCKEAKPLAMTLQGATVGLALEGKPTTVCV